MEIEGERRKREGSQTERKKIERVRERERVKIGRKITWGHEMGSIGHPLIWIPFFPRGK